MKKKQQHEIRITLTPEITAQIIAPYLDEIEKLKEENKKLLEVIPADTNGILLSENKQLRKRLEMSFGEFDSNKELNAYKRFCKKHVKCQLSSKANGGKVPYIVQNGTGVGTCKKVVCQVCGAEEDITDINAW